MSINQAGKLIDLLPEILSLDQAMLGEVFNQINQLVLMEEKKCQPIKPNPEYNTLWFPTPET